MNQLNQRQLQVHVPVAGMLLIFGNFFTLLIGICMFLLLGGIGLAVAEREATPILVTVGSLMAVFLAALSLPGLVAGFGLMARKNWARILAIVVALLGLVNFPVGTLMGIYIAWVLFQEATAEYFGVAAPREGAAPPAP